MLAAQAIGEIAEEECTEDSSGEVGGCGSSDLGVGEMKAVAALEDSGERADESDLEAIEEPGGTEGGNDADVPTGLGEPVHASGMSVSMVRSCVAAGGMRTTSSIWRP